MTSSSPSDQTLVRYLRGELSEEERTEVERSYFADDEVFERLVSFDTDLLDEYTRNEMDPETAGAFERRLGSDPYKERVAFAQALRDAMGDEPVTRPSGLEPQGVPEARSSALRRLLPMAATILLAVAAGWFAVQSAALRKERQQLAARRVDLENRIQRLGEQVAAQERTVEELNRRLRTAASPRVPELRGTTPINDRTVSFLLTAGLLRDPASLNRLDIPAGTSIVRLDLVVEDPGRRSYDAVLEKASGREVWRRQGLRPTKQTPPMETVSVSLPAKVLLPGDYVLVLRGLTARGVSEALAEYVFRVESP